MHGGREIHRMVTSCICLCCTCVYQVGRLVRDPCAVSVRAVTMCILSLQSCTTIAIETCFARLSALGSGSVTLLHAAQQGTTVDSPTAHGHLPSSDRDAVAPREAESTCVSRVNSSKEAFVLLHTPWNVAFVLTIGQNRGQSPRSLLPCPQNLLPTC
jgi:hypothetical protein